MIEDNESDINDNNFLNESSYSLLNLNVSSKEYVKRKDFNSLFAYDVSKNKYEINTEISELEEKYQTYIKETIDFFNIQINLTKLSMPIYVLIIIIIVGLIVFLLCLYVFMFILTISLFNPMVIIVLVVFGFKYVISFFPYIFMLFNDKYKSKKLRRLIQEENNKKKYNKLLWDYGRDGSWIEVKITRN